MKSLDKGAGKGTELARVRGLGSAHHGAGHWQSMHLTSAASLVTCAYLAFSLLLLPDFTYATMRSWLAGPIPAAALALLIVSVFRHTQLGVQTLIEDYVHTPGAKYAALLALNLTLFAAGAFGLLCIARVMIAVASEASATNALATMQQAMQAGQQGAPR